MVPTRQYQYIDLGSDEVVGRRRTFRDNDVARGRGQTEVVVQYQYIEQGVDSFSVSHIWSLLTHTPSYSIHSQRLVDIRIRTELAQ